LILESPFECLVAISVFTKQSKGQGMRVAN
jgi:hypothetical protein